MAQQITQTDNRQAAQSDGAPIVLTGGDDPRVDSRTVALRLGVEHESTVRLLTQYAADFREFGILRFQIGEIKGRGQPEQYALLNEDQAYLLLTYSRNTLLARNAKKALVRAFRAARIAADITKTEYLPSYHNLHDQIGTLAAGSSNARFVHMNINKIVNQAAGINAGQRDRLDLPHRSMLVVAQSVARMAMAQGKDHRDGYQMAKDALQQLSAVAIGAIRAS